MSRLLKITDETWKRIVAEGWSPKRRSVDMILNEVFDERNELRKYVFAMQQAQQLDKDKMDRLMNAMIAIFENGNRNE